MAKKNKKDKGADGAAPGREGIRLSGHPRARRHIRTAKGWGGLLAFLLVLKLSRGAALPWPDALLRGVLGGIAGYLTAWMIAVTVWRHLAIAELEQLRRRLLARIDAQAAAAEADAEAARGATAQS
jgi:hypothetical protein